MIVKADSENPKGKNIVIFSDGTGQEGGVGNNTNVYNVFNMILDRSEEQISFYDQGLGAGGNWLWGSIAGAGISENVGQAYQFLSDNYNAGDRIYLFGFSRGATTLRSLSGFIDLFGILPKSRPELFYQAWKIYRIQKNADKQVRKAREFIQRNHTMWAKIRFLGVWDTVAALALPFKAAEVVRAWIPGFQYKFHNLKMSPSVEYARHALAIDDQRLSFHPELFDERGQTRPASSASGNELFTTNDVTDLHKTAERLNENNPISNRARERFSPQARKRLEEFKQMEGRLTSPDHEDELRKVIVYNLNDILEGPGALCEIPEFPDPKRNKNIAKLPLSATTRELVDKISSSSPNMDLEKLNRLLLEDILLLKPRVKQVWFAGMHTDVGGGYEQNELAHIPLLWMVNEAIDLGLKIYPNHKVNLRPDATGVMHDSRAGIGRLYRSKLRDWDFLEHQSRPPLVHRSVNERQNAVDNYNPWITDMAYVEEPWPVRLQKSIQFDDERIWRKSFWGWGANFDEQWVNIEKITLNDTKTSFSLIMKNTGPIHVEGSLPKDVAALVTHLEYRRERFQRESAEKEFKKIADEVNKVKRSIEELGSTMTDDAQNKLSNLQSRIEKLENS